MKILHITKKYPEALGGDAVVVYNLEKQQEKIGHKVSIVTSNCSGIKNKENVFKFGLKDIAPNLDKITIRRVMSLIILFFWGLKRLGKLYPDIIHSHSADLGFFISFPAGLYHIPVVNTCHSVTFPDKQYGFMKRFAEIFFLKYGRFKRIITVDKSSLESFKEAGINNVIYIPNGVDTERFDRQKQKFEKRGDQKIIFLFVGRLESEKGLKYLFHAVRILKDRTKNFKFLIVGDSSQRNAFKNLAKNLGIEEYIFFMGKVDTDKIIKIYHNSDVFVLPSIHEGLPLTLLEAWAARLPIVTTNVGGIPEICVNRENALIVPPKDPEALADAMIEILEDGMLAKKMGKNGRKLVEEKYTWEKIAEKTEKVYERLI